VISSPESGVRPPQKEYSGSEEERFGPTSAAEHLAD
jgi:hypothetical protein